jgi:hypothetical protein
MSVGDRFDDMSAREAVAASDQSIRADAASDER